MVEPAPVGGAGGVEAGLDREQSEKLFSKPSVQKARQRGLANMPHRIPDDAQPTGFRLARPGELIDLVRLHQSSEWPATISRVCCH